MIDVTQQDQILDQITNQFLTGIEGMGHTLYMAATIIFYSLAGIQLTWMFISKVILSEDSDPIGIMTIIKQVFMLTIIYTFMINISWLLPALMNAFFAVGRSTENVQTLDPSSVISEGLSIAGAILTNLSILGIFKDLAGAIITAIVCIFIVGCYGLIAIELCVNVIKTYFMVLLGALFLSFGALDITKQSATNYVQNALALSIKLMMLYIIIGIGENIGAQWAVEAGQAASNGEIMPFFEIAIGALCYYIIAKEIPNFFASTVAAHFPQGTNAGEALVGSAMTSASFGMSAAAMGMKSTAMAAKGLMTGGAAAGQAFSMAGASASHASGVMGKMSQGAAGLGRAGMEIAKAGKDSFVQSTTDNSFTRNVAERINAVKPPKA